MTGLFWNFSLAACWVFLSSNFEAINYLFGFLIGYLIIALIHQHVPMLNGYPARLPRAISFIFYLAKELAVSNLRVAADIVTSRVLMTPGVLAFKTEAKTNMEITMLSNVITLTPGTLVLDVSEDKTTLFVHAMFLDEVDEVLEQLRELEQRLLQVIR